MAEVVSIFDALPPRVIDKRIDALYRRFGHRPFSITEGATATGIEHHEFWKTFFYSTVEDDRFRVCSTTGGFYLTKVDPARAALPHWRSKYLPAMRRKLPSRFSIQNVADVIQVPYASAAFLIGQFMSAGIILANDEKFEFKPRRVIMNAPRPRVRWGDQPIYIGY